MLFIRIQIRNIDRLKVKGQRQIYHANINQKKIGVDILILVKLDFRDGNKTRDKRKILLKGFHNDNEGQFFKRLKNP